MVFVKTKHIIVMFSNKSKGTKNKNRAIDLELNILCVLLCPVAFVFHGNACLQRNALACIYESEEGKKKAAFGRESQAQSQQSHFIVNLFFWQITSLVKASLKKKETEKQQANTQPCDSWVKIRVKEQNRNARTPRE